MAKQKKKGRGFAIFMVVYAVLALAGIGFGLKWLWGFIGAYEASRPHVPIDAYMESVTPERVVEACEELVSETDANLQDPEDVRLYLLESLSEPITYARKASECTATRQVYVLRSGSQVIGSFSIVSGEEDAYGFTPWVLEEEAFDMSYLMGTEKISVTIPADCGIQVSVNGVELDERYIVNTESTEFALLEDFYSKYELPKFTLVTYEVGPFLGVEPELQVVDAQGQPFTYDDSFDPNSLIVMQDEELAEELKSFVKEFLDAYVIFAGCANDSRYANYSNVIKYVVPESTLAKRMKEALDGLQYAQSRGDVVDTVTFHHLVELTQEAYMCDVTYLVNTTGREGVVQTTTNVKMVLVRSGDKLLVESIVGY
jgi:hypothetical protein